jgi:pimeloyl-ACP methyl ester carboxylesterase
MLGWLTKHVLSAVISLMMIGVPQEKYQKQLDELPGIERRMAGRDLGGWTLEKAQSRTSDVTHYFFHYPSTRPGAPVLLMLHGFNTDGRVFFPLKVLADTFELIAYNFPEKTSLYTGTMADFVPILEDFCRLKGIDTVTLMGNSIGGVVAVHLAAAATQVVVRQLVLVSTTVFGSRPQEVAQVRGMADKLLKYPDYKLYYMLLKGKAIVGRLGNSELGENAPADAVVIKYVAWYREILSALYDYNGADDARRVRCPVLQVHGAADRVIPLASAELARQYMPQTRFYAVAGRGHSLVYSDADSVAVRIRGTL